MNIWQRVAHDHENIAYLLKEMPHAAQGTDVVRSRARLLGDLIGELNAHAKALDASVLAPLGNHEKARPLVSDLRDAHGQIMTRLGDLAEHASDGGEAWLNGFADVAYAVDQHLHRHSHELVPMARELLSANLVEAAAPTFVRAKANVIRTSRKRPARALQANELFLISTVGLATAALALLAWRTGFFGKPEEARSSQPKRWATSADRDDRAAAAAPGERMPGDDLDERQDQLLDQALEETFPGSDPISPKQITK